MSPDEDDEYDEFHEPRTECCDRGDVSTEGMMKEASTERHVLQGRFALMLTSGGAGIELGLLFASPNIILAIFVAVFVASATVTYMRSTP